MFRLSALVAIAIVVVGCGSDTASVEEPAVAETELREMSIPERVDRYESRDNDAVSYSNPNTGYTADYTLDVEYDSDGKVERINFPSGGWIDDFSSETDNHDGTVTVETYDGKSYTVAAGDKTENDDDTDRGEVSGEDE